MKKCNIPRRLVMHAALSSASALALGLSPNFASAQTATPNSAQTPSSNVGTSAPEIKREMVGAGATRLGLLIPSLTGGFGRVAGPLRAGFTVAHARDGQNLGMMILEVGERPQDIATAYAQMSAAGVQVVVGPLTRNSVNALVDSGTALLPTVSLNIPDADRRIPSNLLPFGLAVEVEARQVARMAFDNAAIRVPTRRPLRALALSQPSASGRRAAAAFYDAWRDLGGELPAIVELEMPAPVVPIAGSNVANSNASNPTPSTIGLSAAQSATTAELRAILVESAPDVVFVGGTAEVLRVVRPATGREYPIYGTSQFSGGVGGGMSGGGQRVPELDGVRAVEMPWHVQSDHPAVMAYPRTPSSYTLEMQRLYALGIDAYRVAIEVLAGKQQFEVDGVTGRLQVDRASSRIDRQAVPVEFRNGQIPGFESR
jgi:uncharacterized protein